MESSDFIPGNVLQNFEAEHFPAQGEQSAGIIIEKAFRCLMDQEGFPEIVPCERDTVLTALSGISSNSERLLSKLRRGTEFFQPCSDLFTESGGIACRDGIGKAVKERGKGVGVLFMFKSMPYL
ncbi:Uncharacterised protein [Shigella sonnei]|nr:Uncharacterised protein [Shigella sonnei]SRJ00855.1 Uncharacterised protein [Shigella sonnei]SRJ19292.1 Uncharacterised protein [Shigella sonnei]SRJ27733.1 Uncharacterised protein [Shigella sonnei]SRK11599.1 Uncharacterised protein [Shigella sonnei]